MLHLCLVHVTYIFLVSFMLYVFRAVHEFGFELLKIDTQQTATSGE
jgi:hypothetical protein